MAFIGVRISWLTLPRKELLALLATWATIQGQDTRQALEHLADYLYQGSSCPRETILPSLCHVSTIICLENGKVTELMEIQGWDPVSGNLKLNSLL